MATPASSATSPSPPMPYLSHPPTDQPMALDPLVLHERDLRKQAVQKFLARAEISMVTRALRARLSYASYKAIHNVSHVPIRELEGQLLSQSQAASFNRTIAAKRKSAGTSASHFSNPSISSSSNASGAGASANARRGAASANMPPPPTTSPPRSHHSTVSGPPSGAGHRPASSSRGSAGGQTLYSSILAPPAQLARTVLNANDPPVAPSSRPAPSPRVRAVKASPKSAADRSRTHSKAKQPDKKTVASPERRKAKRASLDKGKGKQKSRDIDADGDVDMKAAATLTSLLLNHRSSIHAGTHSPRSSIDGSETGSTYSYSHFAQSSARSTTATSPPGSISSAAAMTGAEPSYRQQTPPPGPPSVNVQSTTPRPAPTDNEAADLMLFLATSPSPARPTPKPRDPSSYRTLGNESTAIRSKGRILFPSSSAPDLMVHDDPSVIGSRPPPTLARTSDGNYTLSSHGDVPSRNTGDLHGASRVSSSASAVTPAQLLPPASLPLTSSPSRTMPESPLRKENIHQSPKAVFGSGGNSAADFNFNEFINASPSPLRGTTGAGGGPGHKPNLSLRADVGRKLFEEEQMKQSTSLGHQSPGKRHEGHSRSLGASIDIMHS
ncbi:hypothetical protein AN958_12198 [Leucoagaricus sp. SymC.cos]|nr:hypothetical protein AN958_12198 [Leucoagaricus sp. SymC.cos]